MPKRKQPHGDPKEVYATTCSKSRTRFACDCGYMTDSFWDFLDHVCNQDGEDNE